MSNYAIKRISTKNAKVGMELAENVIYSNGLLLMSLDTILTEKHIIKLNLYQINFVQIKDYHLQPSFAKPPKGKETSIVQSENYINFSKNYEEQEIKVKEQLTKISDGDTIKITELFATSTQLVQDLGTQSDLFNYLSHLKTTDDATYTHSLNVSMLCNIFGRWLHLSDDDIQALTVAGLLHDVGKMQIDKQILNKPGRLTPDEFEIIKTHTRLGYDVVKAQDIHEGIKQAVLLHHEKMNGKGYPFGLSWDKIHDFAKIVSIVDIYDAMTSERCYHERHSPFKVIQMFEEQCYGILDTKFMSIFLEHIAHNYIGSSARLSTGEECKIVFAHAHAPSRPIVQIDNLMVDLLNEPTIKILELI